MCVSQKKENAPLEIKVYIFSFKYTIFIYILTFVQVHRNKKKEEKQQLYLFKKFWKKKGYLKHGFVFVTFFELNIISN